jgi:hypothetical protein
MFSKHSLEVMAERGIYKLWVFDTLKKPSLKLAISDIEEHYFSQIDDRCLKVVFNPLDNRIITTYFDRNKRKKGCR